MKRIAKFALLVAVFLAAGIGNLMALNAPQDNWHNYSNLNWTSNGGMYLKSIAIGTNGKLYIGAATSNSKGGTSVQVYSQDGAYIGQFGTLNEIRGLACDSSNNLYVFDYGVKKVRVFDQNGTFLREWGGVTGSGNGQFAVGMPNDSYQMIAVDSGNNVYVADYGNHRIQKFDANGGYLLQWGGSEDLQGQFHYGPYAIAIGPNDRIFTTSSGRKLQIFDTFGAYSDGAVLTFLNNFDAYGLAITCDGLAIAQEDNSSTINVLDEVFTVTSSVSVGMTYPNLGGVGMSCGFATDARGRIYYTDGNNKRVIVLERAFKTENKPIYNAVPQPVVISSEQRPSTTFVDIDYKVVDADDSAVQVAALGFVGVTSGTAGNLGNVLKLRTFAEGTQANLGANITANTVHRLTWNAAADWATTFGNVQVEILAKDGRGLQAFHWITLPAQDTLPEVAINHRSLPDSEVLSIWYWLIATGDPAISLVKGQVIGVGGKYNGAVLADTATTTSMGRTFLYERLNVRAITGGEIARAQSGRYGFQSVDANTVVKGFIAPDFRLSAWGNNGNGQTTVPADTTGVTSIAVGGSFSIKVDGGSLMGWGLPSVINAIPSGLTGITSVAAGSGHILALKSDGTVLAIASGNNVNVSGIPSGLSGVTAIAAGSTHSLALKSDGTVAAWGTNTSGDTTVPANLTGVTAIAAGGSHSLALKNNGTVVAWGSNSSGQTNVPGTLTGVIAIAAGGNHSLALKSDGTVTAWGSNSSGQTTIPSGLTGVTAIAAGSSHSLALKSDGTVVVWGSTTYGQTTIPTGLTGVTALAAGSSANHCLVLSH